MQNTYSSSISHLPCHFSSYHGPLSHMELTACFFSTLNNILSSFRFLYCFIVTVYLQVCLCLINVWAFWEQGPYHNSIEFLKCSTLLRIYCMFNNYLLNKWKYLFKEWLCPQIERRPGRGSEATGIMSKDTIRILLLKRLPTFVT